MSPVFLARNHVGKNHFADSSCSLFIGRSICDKHCHLLTDRALQIPVIFGVGATIANATSLPNSFVHRLDNVGDGLCVLNVDTSKHSSSHREGGVHCTVPHQKITVPAILHDAQGYSVPERLSCSCSCCFAKAELQIAEFFFATFICRIARRQQTRLQRITAQTVGQSVFEHGN